MTFYLYAVSAQSYYTSGLVKLGLTCNLKDRRSTYLTGCPPGLTPSQELEYYGIWETTAGQPAEIAEFEERLHDHFHTHRLFRADSGSTEWFKFATGETGIIAVREFLKGQPWVCGEVPLEEVAAMSRARTSGQLKASYRKNLKILRSFDARISVLTGLQEPVIDAIFAFLSAVTERAAWFTAPCGAGKTLMTANAMSRSGTQRAIICCPRDQIQTHWKAALLSKGVFSEEEILLLGGSGTTDPTKIREHLARLRYCIIPTNMSSHLLLESVTAATPGIDTTLFVFDEVHHMAGEVSALSDSDTDSDKTTDGSDATEKEKELKGRGITRRLLQRCHEFGWKRLSMTFTPRNVYSEDGSSCYSMDDEAVFGPCIAELKLRKMIDAGVLPDYRIWTLHDVSARGEGVLAKAQAILEAWQTLEYRRDPTTLEMAETPMLHHMIVFAANKAEALALFNFFGAAGMTDTTVLHINGSHSSAEKRAIISQFETAKRAIIINCQVLGEGVDIPIADSVAFACSKHTRGQITQMLLRAGRWFPGKALFHILLPILDDKDFDSFKDVLLSLASCDEQLRDEISQRVRPPSSGAAMGGAGTVAPSVAVEDLLITQYEGGQMEDIQRCFRDVLRICCRNNAQIQRLCIQRGIDTSVVYRDVLRIEFPEFPEVPLRRDQTWFDFLHPSSSIETRIPLRTLVTTVVQPNSLFTATDYDRWVLTQSPAVQKSCPSVQHILDGYYAHERVDSYTTLCQRGGVVMVQRRR
jgi:superfamily II DNA or RNA helicase